MKTSKMLMVATAIMMAVMPALADQASAESPGRMSAAQPVVTNVTAQQQAWPSVMVDIHYDVFDADGRTQTVAAAISTNSGALFSILSTNLAGDIGYPVLTGTQKHVVWDAGADLPDFASDLVRVRITADNASGPNLYLVVDVSGGPAATNYPVTYLSSQPILNDFYRKTKLLLRKIPAGNFVMGSPMDELGRYSDENQHTVTLSSNFYMGVFQVTQAQYTNVMGGTNPSYFHGAMRPVEYVSWDMARGGTWPGGTPAAGTFMDKLRSRTGLAFDLPTEAQWEYACRAGTTGAWHNGTTITNTTSDGNLAILGRYYYDGGGSTEHTTVGSYLANNWGLYDMHGNVWEWCLDWYAGSYGGDATDPPGPASGSDRVYRGGSWDDFARSCRSAYRGYDHADTTYFTMGFRLSLPAY